MIFTAIIPLRAGSKRIPKKNTVLLGWKPLFSYTLNAALKSKRIDNIIISTDDKDVIKTIWQKYHKYINNKIVILDRDPEFSKDVSSTIDLIIKDIFKRKKNIDNVILLQATSPLRSHVDIDNAIDLFISSKKDSVVWITKAKEIAYRQYTNKKWKLQPLLWTKYFHIRSQDLPKTFILNGSLYITNKKNLIKNSWFLNNNMIGYVMDNFSSIDIDEIEDLHYCEFLLNKKERNEW